MRLWSIHPKYLDAKGLVALWRETLLAQNVILGKTEGYKNHPQLKRFKDTQSPRKTIASYLETIYQEALKRGYKFDKSKIKNQVLPITINVTTGQIAYEYEHLLKKLKQRDEELYKTFSSLEKVELNPLFKEIDGEVEPWEVVK